MIMLWFYQLNLLILLANYFYLINGKNKDRILLPKLRLRIT